MSIYSALIALIRVRLARESNSSCRGILQEELKELLKKEEADLRNRRSIFSV